MVNRCKLVVLSDVHYAGPEERTRGGDYEIAKVPNLALRLAVRWYRRFIWLNKPFEKNYLLDEFIKQAGSPDYVIANGDYSCDSGFTGVSDEASFASAQECLTKLRERFAGRLFVNFGDHELGKVSMFGGHGGMRLASWHRARAGLGLEPFWQVRVGRYVLIGVVSSLVGLPVFEADTLPEERKEWERLRRAHLAEIRQVFEMLDPGQRVLLFCHDPTALPFLWQETEVRERLKQVEHTIIGHLHSNLYLFKSRCLAGMPPITFLGHTAKRLSSALHRAKYWKPFHVRLCPSLAGIELLKDGGYLTIYLDLAGGQPAQLHKHRLPR